MFIQSDFSIDLSYYEHTVSLIVTSPFRIKRLDTPFWASLSIDTPTLQADNLLPYDAYGKLPDTTAPISCLFDTPHFRR